MNNFPKVLFTLFCLLLLVLVSSCKQKPAIGIFEANTDIGEVGIAGSVVYDAENESYTISGSGENMWFEKDAFHYVYIEEK